MRTPKPRRVVFMKFAAILGALAIFLLASSPAQAGGPRRQYRNGGYRGQTVYRANSYGRGYGGGWGGYTLEGLLRPAPGLLRRSATALRPAGTGLLRTACGLLSSDDVTSGTQVVPGPPSAPRRLRPIQNGIPAWSVGSRG